MLHTPNPELIEQISWLIPQLPSISPITIRCEADYYGASHEIARSIGLENSPLSSGTWRHGWSRRPGTIPEMVATYKPGTRVHLMPDEHHERLLLDAGYPNALAVGYPILYVRPPESERPRCPRTLLAAPFHLLPEVTPPESQVEFEQAFAAYLVSQRAHFDTVCACLHVSCIEQGLWTQTLEKHGIPWVLGAMTNDAHALSRVRTLFESFDCVVTNHIGSVMPYAAHCGARVCIAGPQSQPIQPEHLANHPTYQKHPEALERIRLQLQIPLSEEFPFLLRDPLEAICPKAWADEAVGSKHQIAPEAIARLLGWRLDGDLPTEPPERRKRLLIHLGYSPPALGDAENREKLGRILSSTQPPTSVAVESALKDCQQLLKERKLLLKEASTAQTWHAVSQSWTWRFLGKPLFSLERRLRSALRNKKAPVTEEDSKNL